jgi:hypothetical protein
MEGIIPIRRKTMAKDTNISAEQIIAVKKRLRSLPVKSTGKNREKAMELLTSDFQKAMKKGYTLKDIQGLLAEEGVRIPAYLLKRQTDNERKIPTRKATASATTAGGESTEQAASGQEASERKISASPAGNSTESSDNNVVRNEKKQDLGIAVKTQTPNGEL